MDMREAVICETVRTPVGGYGGSLKDVTATTLAETVIRAVLARTGIPGAAIDDVLLGQCYPSGEAPAIGRVAALDAGLPVTTPGLQIDRRCGSGLQAVIDAAMRVSTGACDVVIAGGAESMSQVEFYSNELRWGVSGGQATLHDRLVRARVTAGGRDYPVDGGMLETAENLRRQYSISRAEQDEFAVESHRKAVAAQREGRFADELVPVHFTDRKGNAVTFDTDEHPRPDSSLETLARLRPVLRKSDPDATVTAGNASGQNDGGSACLVTTPQKAAEYGLRPLVRLVSWGVAGVAPNVMGIGPVPATAKAFARAGLQLADMDLIEVNEAFATQVLACTREWGFGEREFARLNVNGSGISLGHPVGATGGRILATMTHELVRRGGRYALETMCIGGGQGLAAVFENVAG